MPLVPPTTTHRFDASEISAFIALTAASLLAISGCWLVCEAYRPVHTIPADRQRLKENITYIKKTLNWHVGERERERDEVLNER